MCWALYQACVPTETSPPTHMRQAQPREATYSHTVMQDAGYGARVLTWLPPTPEPVFWAQAAWFLGHSAGFSVPPTLQHHPLHWHHFCDACLILLELPSSTLYSGYLPTQSACPAGASVLEGWDGILATWLLKNSQLIYLWNYEHRKGPHTTFSPCAHLHSSSKVGLKRTGFRPTADHGRGARVKRDAPGT